jgi:hypothetical protein
VFASSLAARHALGAFAARALQVCVAHSFVAELRKHNVTGSAREYTNPIVHLGQGANATRIIVPTRDEGRPFTWNLDETAVRQGRLVAVLSTLAGASTARYNQALAAGLANVANREQHQP